MAHLHNFVWVSVHFFLLKSRQQINLLICVVEKRLEEDPHSETLHQPVRVKINQGVQRQKKAFRGGDGMDETQWPFWRVSGSLVGAVNWACCRSWLIKVIPSPLGGMEQQTCADFKSTQSQGVVVAWFHVVCMHESQRQGMFLKEESVNQILIVIRQLEQMSDADKLLQRDWERQWCHGVCTHTLYEGVS